jgi:hypothetical protein
MRITGYSLPERAQGEARQLCDKLDGFSVMAGFGEIGFMHFFGLGFRAQGRPLLRAFLRNEANS